jgi:hypothetical protein
MPLTIILAYTLLYIKKEKFVFSLSTKNDLCSDRSLKDSHVAHNHTISINKLNSDNRLANKQEKPESSDETFKIIHPYLDQYLKNQKQPLENLEKFFEFVSIKKIDLTPELKEEIKKKIDESIAEQKNKQREEELGRELFGAPERVAEGKPGSSGVIPQSSVPPDATCQVCLSEFSSAEHGAVKCPHCGSLFHYRCIAKWVNKNGTCPICKKELKV